MVEMPEKFDGFDDINTLNESFDSISIEDPDETYSFGKVFAIKTVPYANRSLILYIRNQTDLTIHNVELDDGEISLHVVA